MGILDVLENLFALRQGETQWSESFSIAFPAHQVCCRKYSFPGSLTSQRSPPGAAGAAAAGGRRQKNSVTLRLALG